MIFAVTERGTFRRCPRQAWLTSKNGQHLTPMVTPLNLSTGSLVHRAHQWWLENPDTSLYEHTLSASVEMQDGVAARYQKQIGTAPSEAEMQTLLEAIDMALSMAENYEVKWKTPLPPEYKFLKAEQKIEVEVPGTRHECPVCRSSTILKPSCANCLGEGYVSHKLQGRLDGLIQHIPTGRIDILEHKTYAQRPKLEDLLMNDQFTAYAWLVTQLGFNSHIPPMIAYDGMWKRPKVPRGRTFEDLFTRYTIGRTPHELVQFEKYLAIELNNMARMYADPDTHAYINVPWNGCWDCKMRELCVAMTRGEDVKGLIRVKYTQRTDDTDDETETETTSE